MKSQFTPLKKRRQPLWLIRAMTTFYCKQIHRGGHLCSQCRTLIEFETLRYNECEHKDPSTQCQNCTRQCYPDAMRLKINHIVQWAEPKIRWRKPLLFARYYLNGVLHR